MIKRGGISVTKNKRYFEPAIALLLLAITAGGIYSILYIPTEPLTMEEMSALTAWIIAPSMQMFRKK